MPSTVHVYYSGAPRIRDMIAAVEPERPVVAWTQPDELASGIGDVEVLFVAVPPAGFSWAGAGRLRLIQLMGAGADVLLPAPDLAPAVEVAGLRGLFAIEVSEHVLAMMLAQARALPALFRRQAAREWRQFASPTLAGKTVVVVGLGEIGRRVARLCDALGMRVVGVRRDPSPVPHVVEVAPPDALARVFAGADYAVLTVPLTSETRGLVDRRALAALPRHAVLVNAGRGGLLDEAALLDQLRAGELGGAALDVFAEEPLPPESPFWDAPNVIVTSHSAGVGVRYLARAVDVLLDNARRLERGEPRARLVDRDRGY